MNLLNHCVLHLVKNNFCYPQWFILFIFWISLFTASAQDTRLIQGKVTDSSGEALLGATIILENTLINTEIHFITSDHKGMFQASLRRKNAYELRVLYQGLQEYRTRIEPSPDPISLDIQLEVATKYIDEVNIDYIYQPITIKPDTIVFRMDHFRDGSERKIGELLAKLPGMEIRDGKVLFQGNLVNQTLVANKLFFGGGSKLAIENIPADAIKEIELISHFSDVDFMKDILSSEELAMNMVLKEDFKEIYFGDIEGSIGLDKAHELHSALFSFQSDKSIQVISDINNTGKSIFSLDDVIRLQGGSKNYLTTRHSGGELNSGLNDLTRENRQFLSRQQYFTAIGYQRDFSPLLQLSSYLIANHWTTTGFQNNELRYFLQQNPAQESRELNEEKRRFSILLDYRVDYDISPINKIIYRGNFQLASHTDTYQMFSNWNDGRLDTRLSQQMQNTPMQITQSLEWNRKISPNWALLTTVDMNIEYGTSFNDWSANSLPALEIFPEISGFTPIQFTNDRLQSGYGVYLFTQLFWTINRYHQLIASIRFNRRTQYWRNSDEISDTKDLSIPRSALDSLGFNNEITFNRSDLTTSISYRLTKEKWKIMYHNNLQYNRQLSTQYRSSNLQNRWIYLPKLQIDYQFALAENLNFITERMVRYPGIQLINNSYQLISFNSLQLGNSTLSLEDLYQISLSYRNFNSPKHRIWAYSYYTNKVVSFRNDLQSDPLRQIYQPRQITTPDQALHTAVSYEYGAKRILPKINLRNNLTKFTQSIDGIDILTSLTDLGYQLGVRTNYSRWPNFTLDIDQSFKRFDGLNTSRFINTQLHSSSTYLFLDKWRFFIKYLFGSNMNRENLQSLTYRTLDAELTYTWASRSWSIYLQGNNLTNTSQIASNQVFDYLTNQQTVYVLPRQTLLGLRYKL